MNGIGFDEQSARDGVISGLERHGLALDGAALDRLAKWLVLLARHNRRANLVGPMGLDRLVDEIVCDSLQGLALLPPTGRMLDVGSGAGVPGTPLACAAPGIETTWLEPRAKRATFLDVARRTLQLSGEVVRDRIEGLDESARFDVLVSRAVFAPDRWLVEATWRLSEAGSVLVWVNGADLPAPPAGLVLDRSRAYRLADGRDRTVASFVAG